MTSDVSGAACGSDNQIFGTIHNPDQMTRAAIGAIEGESTQSH